MVPFESWSLSKEGESDGRWTVLEQQDSQQTGRITDSNSLRVHVQSQTIHRFVLRIPDAFSKQFDVQRYIPLGAWKKNRWWIMIDIPMHYNIPHYPQLNRIEVGLIGYSGL